MIRSLYPRFLAVAGILLAIWLGGRYLLPLIFPFLLGLGLALLAEPMAAYFWQRFHIPRGIAAGIGVSMAFCFLALVVLLLGALIVRELGVLAGVLPDLGTMAKTGIASLGSWLQSLTRFAPGSLQPSLSRGIGEFFSGGTALLDKAVGYVLGLAGGVLSHVPDSALSLGTGLISSYMISAKLPSIRDWLKKRLPRERLQPGLDAWKRVRAAVGGWLLAQVKLAGVTWGILTVGFLLLRISFGPLWAFLVALVDTFPVLGTGTVLIPWSVICLLQGDHGRGIGLLGIYAVVTLTRSVLEPRLVGRHLGLDPLVTLFALYAGYKIWGLPGMILAPMIAVVIAQLLPEKGQSTEGKL